MEWERGQALGPGQVPTWPLLSQERRGGLAGPWLGWGAEWAALPLLGKGPVREEPRAGRAGGHRGPQGRPAEAHGEEQGAAGWSWPLPRGACPEEAVPSQEHQGVRGSQTPPAGRPRGRRGDAQVPGPACRGHGARGRQVTDAIATQGPLASVTQSLRRGWAVAGTGPHPGAEPAAPSAHLPLHPLGGPRGGRVPGCILERS